jgi:allophanate hydrolase subunit 1
MRVTLLDQDILNTQTEIPEVDQFEQDSQIIDDVLPQCFDTLSVDPGDSVIAQEMYSINLESIHKQLGLTFKHKPSISTEDFKERFNQIIAAVVKTAKAVWVKIVEFITNLFYSFERLEKKIHKLEAGLSKIHNAEKTASFAKSINLSHHFEMTEDKPDVINSKAISFATIDYVFTRHRDLTKNSLIFLDSLAEQKQDVETLKQVVGGVPGAAEKAEALIKETGPKLKRSFEEFSKIFSVRANTSNVAVYDYKGLLDREILECVIEFHSDSNTSKTSNAGYRIACSYGLRKTMNEKTYDHDIEIIDPKQLKKIIDNMKVMCDLSIKFKAIKDKHNRFMSFLDEYTIGMFERNNHRNKEMTQSLDQKNAHQIFASYLSFLKFGLQSTSFLVGKLPALNFKACVAGMRYIDLCIKHYKVGETPATELLLSYNK